MKINVTSIVVKKEGKNAQGKDYKIYTVTTEEGPEYDTFDYLEPGEHEGDIKENPPYSPQFKLKKEPRKGGFQKDYSFEKKRVALECATALLAAGKIDITQLTETRDKFFNYLNS